MKYSAPRGTRDILPDEGIKRKHIVNIIINLLETHGYQEIKTPIFEQTNLFARGIGTLTDIVEKEMYNFKDKKNRCLTLRPEGTASIARAYIENNLSRSGFKKLYYYGPMFRYERPQAGRYRQFEQIGIEAIGSANAMVDAEVILIGLRICQKIGINKTKVLINSVGCPICRPVIREQLRSFITNSLKYLCSDCQRRYSKNPLRILDCKKEKCKTYFAGLPSPIKVLCQECTDHYNTVLNYLESIKIKYKVDPFLVRGLDYYTKTVFEISTEKIGAQNSICGGGRYDELIAELGGPATPAFGLAFGIDRLAMVLEQEKITTKTPHLELYIAAFGEAARQKAFSIMDMLCTAGIKTEIDLENRSFKSQFKQANTKKAQYVCIIGEDELEKQVCQLKDMKAREQKTIKIKDLKETLLNLLRNKAIDHH